MSKEPNICDYSDTDYKTDFWGNGKRDYEDYVERKAVLKLFPPRVGRFLEIGAGFGRLVDVYADRCSKITLMDYAPNLVAQAQEKIKALELNDAQAVQGNIYDLSQFVSKFDGCMMIRVLHHIEDVDAAFKQINSKLNRESFFILEYANKRNFLEIIRKLIGRSLINPFSKEPEKRGDGIFYNYHPDYVKEKLEANGFVVEKELMVSLFRNKLLKKVFGKTILGIVEGLLQRPLAFLRLSPSIWVRARKVKTV